MIHVIHADFKTLPLDTFDGFDHMISDAPYSGHTHSHATSTGNNGRGPVDRDFGFAPLKTEDRRAALLIAKRLPRWAILFSDFAKGADQYPDLDEVTASAEAGHYLIDGDAAWRVEAVHLGLEYVRLVPWIRWSQPQITGDRPCSGAEAVLHFHGKDGRKPRKKHWNGPGGLTHYARKSLRGDDKHPTEKPLDLMLDLVCFFTDPGEAILDLFAGRCTTGLAARLLGRDCLCVEQIAQWAELGALRCEGPLTDRDRDAAREWAESTAEQADKEIADKTSTENAIRRANARLADAQRVYDKVA